MNTHRSIGSEQQPSGGVIAQICPFTPRHPVLRCIDIGIRTGAGQVTAQIISQRRRPCAGQLVEAVGGVIARDVVMDS